MHLDVHVGNVVLIQIINGIKSPGPLVEPRCVDDVCIRIGEAARYRSAFDT